MGQGSIGRALRWLRLARRGHCAIVALVLCPCVAPSVATAQNLTLPPAAPADEAATETGAAARQAAVQLAAASSPSDPPKARSISLDEALARRGDLTLRNSSIDGALFTISELWHINIVVGEVKGTVNGVFKDAPLREILDSILLSNGYGYRPVGESLVVSSLSELGQINPFFESATIPVRTADVDEVVEGAKLLSTPQGQVRAIKSARSIFVLDFPDRVTMIREFVTAIDGASGRGLVAGGVGFGSARYAQPLEVAYFRTQFISAKTAEQALQAVLSKDGRVGVLEKEDRLIVSDYAENLAMVEKVLERIDYPRPQVRITALIYDISLQDIEQLGFNWNQVIKTRVGAPTDDFPHGEPGTALGVDSFMQVPFQEGVTGGALTFLSLSRHLDIGAVMLAMQNANDARLLADPNVAVLDNEEATFQSITEIPFQQLTQTAQGGQIGTTSFKEAGITLKVRPKIASDCTIEMQVTPEFSRLTGFTPGDNQPIIDRRTAATVLRVANGQTVVIGGLRQRSDVGDFKGVPYLKDMKLVGRLFRSRETNVRESELVVFISPEIIGYSDEPRVRQQMVSDTVDCRLNQIPEAEGCPPCCRRLPLEATMGGPPCGAPSTPALEVRPELAPEIAPPVDDLILPLPEDAPPSDDELPPLEAGDIPSSEMQFGAVGRAPHVQALVADGRLRRLPTVGGNPRTAALDLSSDAFVPLLAQPAPLRPDFEARSRATEGIYSTQQRPSERRLPPVAPESRDEIYVR